MGDARWEHFAHEADMGVRGIGSSLEEAFEEAAIALTAVITDPGSVDAGEMVEVECEAPDEEILLTEWLNALIYEMATRGMLWGRFEVKVEGLKLHGRAWGEKVDIEKHQPAVEVKGATYTQLRVKKEDGHWIAQCVVDV